MPKFYLNVRDERGLTPAGAGVEFRDLEEARDEAERGARLMVAQALGDGVRLDDALNRTFEISDDRGATLLIVPFGMRAGA